MDAIDIRFFENETKRFLHSKKRLDMINGEKYFLGEHDILYRKREVIDENGQLKEVKNLPNAKIVDNQYGKMVSQKANYLVGKPFTISAENETYIKALKKIFNNKFFHNFKRLGQDSLNFGVGWLYVYYDDLGKLAFKRIKASEIMAGWADSDHTELDYAIRVYEVEGYDDKNQYRIFKKVEIYKQEGVYFFDLSYGKLMPETIPFKAYIFDGENEYGWQKIPLVPFRYNEYEQSLLHKVKSLQDGINLIKSNFQNNMTEDIRNTIMVLINYDGEDPGEFRQNLSQYGVIKVSTVEGVAGDVKTLQIEVNAENYKVVLDLLKKALIENAMGYDAKDDRLAGNPNQMNIQSMYSDIDLDADGMETEYQAAFEDLLWFVNCYLNHMGIGDFENEEVEIIFNRDILINESDVIDNIQKSQGLLSMKTLISQHPWVDDVEQEMERLKEEQGTEYSPFSKEGEKNDILAE